MTNWTAVVLAAGGGSRMRSRIPKIMHEVAGRPILSWVLQNARQAGVEDLVVVLGPATETARSIVPEPAVIVYQPQARGTADAVHVAMSRSALGQQILVLNGDVPLLRPDTLLSLCRKHVACGATITFLTAFLNDSAGLGKVRRGPDGTPQAILEARDQPSQHEQPEVHEINVGAYCFREDWLRGHLSEITPNAATGELYLTDLIRLAAEDAVRIETVTSDADEAHGINTRAELALAEGIARQRIRDRLLAEGVSMVDPKSIFIDADVVIGRDTVIQPNTHISGTTAIGEDCEIGPNTILRSSQIGNRCRVFASVVEDAAVEDDVNIGPFSHLRPGASIGPGVELGNYAEVKESRLGPGTKMHHFSYVGDATIGANVNIGAGAITCNFDGEAKHRTVVGDDAFVGSDTMLVAPVTLGDGARTGAGSVVTRDVEAGTVVVGVPARPFRRPFVEKDDGHGDSGAAAGPLS